MQLDDEITRILINYLAAHEDDIAQEINDFGQLKLLFLIVLNRPAEYS